MELLNFVAVASEAVASLVSRYEKAYTHENKFFCGLLLWLMKKKERKTIFMWDT